MKTKKISLSCCSVYFIALFALSAAHADQSFTECSAECVAVGNQQAQDLGPVIGAAETDVEAYEDLVQSCQVLAYNANACLSLQATLAKSMKLYQSTTQGWIDTNQAAFGVGWAFGFSAFAAINSTQASYSNSQFELVLDYARMTDPSICRPAQATQIPSLPKPVQAPQPYCGGGTPLG